MSIYVVMLALLIENLSDRDIMVLDILRNFIDRYAMHHEMITNVYSLAKRKLAAVFTELFTVIKVEG